LKQVVEELAREKPSLKNFVTLSPMPRFAAWLERAAEAEDDADDVGEQARAVLARQIRQGVYDQAGEARASLLSALRAINRAQLGISNPKVLTHD